MKYSALVLKSEITKPSSSLNLILIYNVYHADH